MIGKSSNTAAINANNVKATSVRQSQVEGMLNTAISTGVLPSSTSVSAISSSDQDSKISPKDVIAKTSPKSITSNQPFLSTHPSGLSAGAIDTNTATAMALGETQVESASNLSNLPMALQKGMVTLNAVTSQLRSKALQS